MAGSDYTLTFDDRGTYLYAFLTGQDSFAASLSYWNAIADEVKRFGYTKLLVHEQLEGNVDAGEVFQIIMNLKESALRGVQIAFYDENREDIPINALGQLVANNRGGTVRLFHNLAAATDWIEQDD
ncbi:MAG TPA: hypothetical protein VLL07_06735 [Pontiella sp.]|nr:hypothetical protein [Pontiella sp.]